MTLRHKSLKIGRS